MKKLSKLTLVAVILFTSFNSCDYSLNNPADSKDFEKISKIKKDSVFINLLKDTYIAIKQIKSPELAKKLISKGENITPAEIDKLAEALGFENREAFIQNYKSYRNAIQYLNAKYNYSSYDVEAIQSLAVEAVDFSILKKGSALYASDCVDTCVEIGENCAVRVTALAVAGHLACASLDITFILGAMCHGAVLVAQDAGLDNCALEAKKCIDGC